MKKSLNVLILFCLLAAMPFSSARAQDDEPYRVKLRRDFGYGNGAEIQGNMTLSLAGNESNVTKVTFMIDEEELISLDKTPFQVSFNTDDFSPAVHDLTARVETRDGKVYETASISYRFLSKSEADQSMEGIFIPLLGLFLVIFLLSLGIQYVTSGKSNGSADGSRSYGGIYGGAICPKCGHPFKRSFLGMNMIAGRLERCPSCGKWILSTRATPDALRSAEEQENSMLQRNIQPLASSENPIDQLEDSRYIDPERDEEF